MEVFLVRQNNSGSTRIMSSICQEDKCVNSMNSYMHFSEITLVEIRTVQKNFDCSPCVYSFPYQCDGILNNEETLHISRS
jgi:hypothetical protein